MAIEVNGRTYGLGGLIALLVLVACFVLAIMGGATSALVVLALIGALALAMLV